MILRRTYLRSLLIIVLLILLILLTITLVERQRLSGINQTLQQLMTGRFIDAEEVDLSQPENQFAYAWHLHQQGLFEQAVDAYGKAERSVTSDFVKVIHYNMGNLYLEQAIEVAEQMGIDRATALADVAKDLFRTALKQDPDFWAAKYNLEAAQRLSRDLPLGDLQESGAAEETSEELWSAMPGFPLGLP
ncbi:MxaK protein [Methylophaga sp.]|jgi:mxaK protein|uniref:MxaK protein n=1 Tax=Methylophaga sp. TaxID=2024840 RepID=UPI0013FF362A|nr:MxaK protein [Methylophaga sp.]MTI63556.1 MxaK protein [Methylophaga sp.]